MTNWRKELEAAIGEQITKLDSQPPSEREMLSYLYDKHKSMRVVANLLGVHRKTVQLKLRSLGIERRPSGGRNNYVADLHPRRFGFKTEEEMLMSWFQEGFSGVEISRRLASEGVKLCSSAVNVRIRKIKEKQSNIEE